jgi:hypothetical protein
MATAEGVQSDTATLVVVAGPVVSGGVGDTGVLVACNSIHEHVKGWLFTVKFAYSHSASGVDTASHDPVAFSVDDSGEVTVRLAALSGEPDLQLWEDDHNAAAVNGFVMVNDMESDQTDVGLVTNRIQASGAAVNDALGVASLQVVTLPTECTYAFSFSPVVIAEIIGDDGLVRTDTVESYSPAMIYASSPLIESNASGPLVLAGSADFPVRNMLGVAPTSTDPVLGEYVLTAWPAFLMKSSGVVPDLGYGTAKVSWRIVAIE